MEKKKPDTYGPPGSRYHVNQGLKQQQQQCWNRSPSSSGTDGYKNCKRSSLFSLSSKRRMVSRDNGKKARYNTYGPSGSQHHVNQGLKYKHKLISQLMIIHIENV